MKSKKSNSWSLWGYALFIFSFIVILAFFNTWVDTPIVYWSNSKNECVKVVKQGMEYGCQDLPEKYTRVWVK